MVMVVHCPPGADEKAPDQYHHPESNYDSTCGAKWLTVEFVVFRSDRTAYRSFVDGLLHLTRGYNGCSKPDLASSRLCKTSGEARQLSQRIFSLPEKLSQKRTRIQPI